MRCLHRLWKFAEGVKEKFGKKFLQGIISSYVNNILQMNLFSYFEFIVH